MAASPPLSVNLQERVALVTGAGRGIGRACALALAQAGARVFAVARSAPDLDKLAEENPLIEAWAADVLSGTLLDRIGQLEQLDVLVNNAGTNHPEPFVDVTAETLDRMLNLNVRANFLVAQAAARVMQRRGRGGSIIHMSSQMGHVGSPGRTVYCMTKHAVEGLTRAMAVELAPENIRVNAVAPTFIETPLTRPMLDDPEFSSFVQSMIPLGRVGQPQDVASAVLYLASDAATMITGHSLRVDGGWTAA